MPAGSPQGGQWTSGGGGGGGGLTGSVGFLDDAAGVADSIGADAADQTAFSVDPNVASDVGRSLTQGISDFIVNLLDEEGGDHDGHAVRDHVGRTDEQLRERVRDSYREKWWCVAEMDTRAGSFPSLEAANKLVNAVLAQNSTILANVASGKISVNKRVDSIFSSPTGREAYTLAPRRRSAPIFYRTTYGVAVVIKHDKKSRKGYSIITAFPFF